MRKLTIIQVQVDESWAFIGAKQENVRDDANPALGMGDCYTYTAIDPITKLMPCWMLGCRSKECVEQFMADLAPRLLNRVQLTTDGMNGYPATVAKAFGAYAAQNKTYANQPTTDESSLRYGANVVTGITKAMAICTPLLLDVSTSHAERGNRAMRMSIAPVHQADKRFQEEDRQPHSCGQLALHVLQLRLASQAAALYAGHGGRHRDACVAH